MSRAGLVRAAVAVGAVVGLGAGLLVPSSERWMVRAAAESSSAGDLPYLQVDGRFLTAGGEPFFWLADTAWAMLGKLSEAEITDLEGAHVVTATSVLVVGEEQS